MSRATAATRRFRHLVSLLQEVARWRGALTVLEWDMEVMMPPGGAKRQAETMGEVSRMAHERSVAPALGDLLAALAEDAAAGRLTASQAAVVREAARDYARETKLPAALVADLTATCAASHHVWVEAREKSDFRIFAPALTRIVDLQRQKAACLGYQGTPYDALLDEYEPGNTVAVLEPLFATLAARLADLLQRVMSSPAYATTPDDAYPVAMAAADQVALNRRVAAALGFDFQRGRLDVSAHPFTTGYHPDDCRLTTRFDEQNFLYGLFSTIHETGHGLYEQGVPRRWWGTPLGRASTMGVHESQSRFWENVVGRSRPFAAWLHGQLEGGGLVSPGGPSAVDRLFRDLNRIQPSLIRTEADEVTYNLHICLRFEIERDLIGGSLEVADLPAAWNDKTRRYLGLTPPDDAHGCLQDVHHSAGLFGYFPSYTLGNLLAAQLTVALRQDLPELDELVAQGEFAPVLRWLRGRVHRHGAGHEPAALVKMITGEPLSEKYLLGYLEDKARSLYRL